MVKRYDYSVWMRLRVTKIPVCSDNLFNKQRVLCTVSSINGVLNLAEKQHIERIYVLPNLFTGLVPVIFPDELKQILETFNYDKLYLGSHHLIVLSLYIHSSPKENNQNLTAVMRNMNDEKPAPIDYSIDEYKDMLKVKGRCTLGNKTVYRVYVYTSDYAKRRDYCGLYIVEEYARIYAYGDIEKPVVMKFPLSSQHKSWFLAVLYYFAFKDPEWQATHVDDFVELKHITELIFCDTYRCYPTVLGCFL